VSVGGVVAVLGIGTAAWAFFTSRGSGTASASVGTIYQPTGVTVPSTSNGTAISVSWTAPTEPAGVTLDGYYVQRLVGSTPSPACGSSPTSLISGTSCSDTGVSSGSYTYEVTAVFRSWTATSAPSNSVVVDSTTPTASAPGVAATVTYGTNPKWTDGQDVTLTDAPTDVGGTGVSSVAYYYCPSSAGSCTSSTPWISIGSSSSSGTSWSVSWTVPPPVDGTYKVVAVATGNNTNVSSPSAATLVGIDTTPPNVSQPIVNGQT
jgi:hypothetical protein